MDSHPVQQRGRKTLPAVALLYTQAGGPAATGAIFVHAVSANARLGATGRVHFEGVLVFAARVRRQLNFVY